MTLTWYQCERPGAFPGGWQRGSACRRWDTRWWSGAAVGGTPGVAHSTLLYTTTPKQCFGSGWIRIKFVSWIRIPNADPDPAADKISSKSQNNSYHIELFD